MTLDFAQLRKANLQRVAHWHPGFPHDGWSGADWSNAAAGEMGEAANVVKKLRRSETGTAGANDPDPETLLVMLGNEIADTIIYLDLLAAYYGIDVAAAVVRKFDAVSKREGFPERLDTALMNETCTCGRLYLGMTVTEARNWSPDCPEHGLKSEWWNSPEQVAKRKQDSERLRDLQRQAREGRERAAEQENP